MRATLHARLLKLWWLPAFALGIAAFILFKDFGIAWDDPAQARYGDLLLAYYSTGGQDMRFDTFMDLRYYGGAFELATQFIASHAPWTTFETRRLVGALAGAAGVLGASNLGLFMGGPGVAWLSGLLLVTWPAWFGHSFINSKDIPFAAAYVWAVYFLVRLADAGSPRRQDHLGFGIAAGLAMGVRSGGLFLLVLYASVLLLKLVRSGSAGPSLRERGRIALPFLMTFALSWILMVAAWPWTHVAPLSRPLESAGFMAQFPRALEVLFRGTLVPSNELPWNYLPTWIAISSPPLVLILLLISLPVAARRIRRDPGDLRPSHWILGLSAVAPIVIAIAGHVVLYDGLRQILFTLPSLGVLASLSAVHLFRRVKPFGPRLLLIGVAAGLSVDPVARLIDLHPYQYAYFNRFAGGLKGAATRFESDYWGLSLREGAEWLRENKSRLRAQGRLRVFIPPNCANPLSAEHYFSPSMRLTENLQSADVVLAPIRFGCDQRTPGEVVFQVERQGAVLAVVKAVARPEPEQ